MKPILVAALAVLLTGSLAQADVERSFTWDSRVLTVTNLVGEVEVVPGEGDAFLVTAVVRGEDAADGLLKFVTEEGRDGGLAVIYPLDEHDDYVYPHLDGNSKTTISYREGGSERKSWLKKIFTGMTGRRVTVRDHGKGLEVWADLTIEVPAGRSLYVKQGVGTIAARRVEGDLDLDISSGGISVEDITGEVRIDTGSAPVVVTRVTGDLNVDTGSGTVDIREFRGNRILVDTGSGRVAVRDAVCDYLHVDTGSGGVEARQVTAQRAKIDTGSGAVTLQLDGMGPGSFIIDTGSGGIEILLPLDASADIVADTGSGRIHHRIDAARVRHSSPDELAMVVGDGKAKVRLDTGSGSITIRGK